MLRHEGIEGSEIADTLAKKRAKAPFISSEPYCGLTKAHLACEIYEWEKIERESHWKQVPGSRSTTSVKVCDISIINHLVKWARPRLGRAACRNSGTFIFCFDGLSRKRLQRLGGTILTHFQITDVAPSRRAKFLRFILEEGSRTKDQTWSYCG